MGFGQAYRAHLVQRHRATGLCRLPGGLASGQAPANDVDRLHGHRNSADVCPRQLSAAVMAPSVAAASALGTGMAKIPVGRTIGTAYGFLFGQIGTILGIAGVPAILYAGADYASRAHAAAQPVPMDADAAMASGAGMLVTLCAEFVQLFAL